MAKNIYCAAKRLELHFLNNLFNGIFVRVSVNDPAYEDEDAIQEMGSKKAARDYAKNYACIEISWDQPELEGDRPYVNEEFDYYRFISDLRSFLQKWFGNDVTISDIRNYMYFEVQRQSKKVG